MPPSRMPSSSTAPGSMGLAGKMEGARAALETLAATRVPGDDFALFVFAEGEVKEVVGFTEDAERIVAAARQVKPWGKTAFRDALARMPEKSLQGKNGSKAIILLSDGIDNDSRITEPELAKLMEGVEIPVFPLGLRSPGALMQPLPGMTVEWMLDVDVLSHIARITGRADGPRRRPRPAPGSYPRHSERLAVSIPDWFFSDGYRSGKIPAPHLEGGRPGPPRPREGRIPRFRPSRVRAAQFRNQMSER